MTTFEWLIVAWAIITQLVLPLLELILMGIGFIMLTAYCYNKLKDYQHGKDTRH